MRKIRPGEEVRFQGERWTVSRIDPDRTQPVRLLRTAPGGTEIRWATEAELRHPESYVRAVVDTARA